MSQAQFAEAIRAAGNAIGVPNHCTKRLVQKWETGEHATCRPVYLKVLQVVTGLSARELGFRTLPDDSGTRAGSDIAADSVDAANSVSTTAALSARTTDAPIDRSSGRLHHAINHPSVVDARSAALLEAGTARLFDLEHHSPARLLAPTAERHLANVTAHLTAARHETVRRSLINSAGRSALLAGWLAFDRGHRYDAHNLWADAISAAEATMDTALLAATLTFQSHAAFRHGDPGSAWQFAHDAIQHAPDDPRATAWATARAALYAAHVDEREAAEGAMERALEIDETLENPKPGDGTLPWMRSIDHARLLSTIAYTAAVLKHPDAAEFGTRAVNALDETTTKSRTIVLSEAALTAAITGELELCLDYGSKAAKLAHKLDVSTAVDRLNDVLPVLLPFCDTPAVRNLLPQLARLKRTADREDEADQEKPAPAHSAAQPSEHG
ncbi:hypothetical protein [Actinospica sp.]|uniref:hypothetical protein n=1 Tax=Actinospica sp. TaxID=1872142 RepID=UPI002C03EE25|nr:hypothetical protein [Actinospica sp.]HWG27529.1 hypothetical protein [Actinospica sp.]